MSRIFVSYKRKDGRQAYSIIEQIRSRLGVDCWCDIDGIETQAQFRTKICDAIDEAEVVLFMHSKHHLNIDLDNDWTIKELNYATAKKKKIILIKLDDTQLENLFLLEYGSKNYIEAQDPVQMDKLMKDLSKWLKIDEKPDKTLIPRKKIKVPKWVYYTMAAIAVVTVLLLLIPKSCSEPEPEPVPVKETAPVVRPSSTSGSRSTTPKPSQSNTETTVSAPSDGTGLGDTQIIILISLGLDKTTLTLDEGSNSTLNVKFNPSNVINKKATWRSSNPKVASVDKNGKVTALKAGTAVITATCEGKEVSCKVTVNAKPVAVVQPEAELTIVSTPPVTPQQQIVVVAEPVDLGLSVKWATCNVGASVPTDLGYYYSWGELATKEEYSWSTYLFCEGSDNRITKYCTRKKEGYKGFTDDLTVLEPADDVATKFWGGSWRMPTIDEFKELEANCVWSWEENNGVMGYMVTSSVEGFEDKSVFFPAAGYYEGVKLSNAGLKGYYWSSSVAVNSPDHAHGLSFDLKGHYTEYRDDRYDGRPVRPVCP